MTANIKVGDYVTIAHCGVRTFIVDSVTQERYADAEVQFEETYYDCTCVDTGEMTLADTSTISPLSFGDNYEDDDLSEEELRFIGELAGDIAEEVMEEIADLERQKLGIAEKIREKTVDDLLIELQDTMTLREMFGDHEDEERKDRKYALRVCEIKAKLIEVTSGKPIVEEDD